MHESRQSNIKTSCTYEPASTVINNYGQFCFTDTVTTDSHLQHQGVCPIGHDGTGWGDSCTKPREMRGEWIGPQCDKS